MKTIVFAYHSMGCAGLRALLRHGFEVVAVFTHTDDPAENIWFESVAELAASEGIPVFAPADVNHPLSVAKIRALNPEIGFSFYYRRLLRPALLECFPKGCLNLHGSLLPKYRGRCPVNWVLVNGEPETGVTLHYMTPRADDGDIVAQRRVGIDVEDTARSLFEKLLAAADPLLDDALPALLAGTAQRTPQDDRQATYFGGRTPADGEIDWAADAAAVRNLVRAVTHPYPGAFTHHGERKFFLWQVTEVPGRTGEPGTVLSADPLTVACGKGAVRVDYAQAEGEVYTTGTQLAAEHAIGAGLRFDPSVESRLQATRAKTVLILGVNGFIGNALVERLLQNERYEVFGMDLRSSKLSRLLDNPRLHFAEGDIAVHREWIEYHVRMSDVVIPLVAIATPIEYQRNPLGVFNLAFEENLRIVRYCAKYGKRLVFPSSSEVYGMCADPEFREDGSELVLGPIRKQRWIYACAKQLLDRVIWAYGQQENLRFVLFRPFNWIGPRLDSLDSARIGSSRVITQLILNLVEGSPIRLVDGGAQKRCFTDVRDGVECLYRILENDDCDGQIFNIGNPDNEASVKELAELLIEEFEAHPLRKRFPPPAGTRDIESSRYYGPGYQDVQHRKPSIEKARRLLGWAPAVKLEDAVANTLDFFLGQAAADQK